jgi:hypothetical protein
MRQHPAIGDGQGLVGTIRAVGYASRLCANDELPRCYEPTTMSEYFLPPERWTIRRLSQLHRGSAIAGLWLLDLAAGIATRPMKADCA